MAVFNEKTRMGINKERKWTTNKETKITVPINTQNNERIYIYIFTITYKIESVVKKKKKNARAKWTSKKKKERNKQKWAKKQIQSTFYFLLSIIVFIWRALYIYIAIPKKKNFFILTSILFLLDYFKCICHAILLFYLHFIVIEYFLA